MTAVIISGLDVDSGPPPVFVRIGGLDVESPQETPPPDPDDGPATSTMDTVTIVVAPLDPGVGTGMYYQGSGGWERLADSGDGVDIYWRNNAGWFLLGEA